MRSLLAGFLAVAWLAGQSPAGGIVVFNARIFTGDTARPWADAIAIDGARIAAVGTTAAIRARFASAARSIDAGGRLLIPGINDAHTHVGPFPETTELDGPPAMEHDPTLDEVIARIRQAVAKAPPGGWISGEIAARVLDDPRATRATLDPVAGQHPLILKAWTGHGTILNTTALRRLGFADDERDPPGGTFGRGPDGRTLTGLAHEYADYLARRRLSALSAGPGTRSQAEVFTTYMQAAAANGITSSQVMLTAVPAANANRNLAAATIRMRLIDFPFGPMPAWRAGPRPAPASPLVTLSGTKWILDGTPIERLMLLREPYSDAPATKGQLNFADSDIRAFLRAALAAREQPMFHAVGDGAIATALDALEATGGERWRALRPRIEHGDLFSLADVVRARRLGVIVVQNPSHFMIAQQMALRLGADRAKRVTMVKGIVEAGMPFALGSDGPMNPFLNIMFATINANNPAQALTIEQALRAYTWGSAYAESAEMQKGTIKPGMLADVALLSQDIFKVPTPELPATSSVLTIVNGRIVFEKMR